MADPRLDTKFEGIGAEYVTYKIDNSTITYDSTKKNGSSQVGLAVRLSTHETVELVGDGEAVLGKLISVDKDNYCVVQTGGYVALPGGSGATLTPGTKIVGDLGAASAEGYVRSVVSAGVAYSQSEAQEIARARGEIIDASTTTAVVVRL